MRKFLFFVLVIAMTSCCRQSNETANDVETKDIISQADTTDFTNDFYDNAETYQLQLPDLHVGGEILNQGNIDLSKLPLHTVIVKEAVLDGEGNRFVGAYRYDGYSLYDILNLVKIKKSNEKEFNPIIDLYVTIENEKGEKVVVSWGEIYYPNKLHNIIIAKQVARIVPSKTKDLWILPEESKLIVVSDLITERNITLPSKITVNSCKKSFKTVKGLKPLLSKTIDIFDHDKIVNTLNSLPDSVMINTFSTIFYGRGRGIHSTSPFTGAMLKNILSPYFEINKKNIMEATFLVVAKDGYRGVFSFSEVMNRNDQSEILLICDPELKDNGIFRLFPACDFFSDRAIKGINAVYFLDSE